MNTPILESTAYILTIPTDSEELATLLENHAGDWAPVLSFFESLAHSRCIALKSREVAEIMRKKYEY